MQESIRVQISHAFQDLLHDCLDFFLVEGYSAALRGACAPLEDAQQRAALDERGHDRYARMVRWQCERREHAVGSAIRHAAGSPGTHRSTLGCLHSPSRCASRISCDKSVLETLTAHGRHSSIVESGSLNTAE